MPIISKKGQPIAPMRTLSITEVLERVQALISAFTGEHPDTITEAGPVAGRKNLPGTAFVKAVNAHFFPKPLKGFLNLPATVGQLVTAIDDRRDQQLAALKHKKPVPAAGANLAMLAGAPAGNQGVADGYPPAPLVVLSLADTKGRVKRIMGAQSGEAPGSISDNSPVLRPNIVWTRLLNAINAHFFPGDLHGILGFIPGETVGALSQRIKWTRDPQL
jgi:hypothetical protein